jgi:LacI family transcriptional regulator, galactose operon repressor
VATADSRLTVTIQEVARRAQVSVGTVSNVLNRPEIVSPKTRERVLRVIDELGFVRNESARHLRSGSGRTIGLVLLDLANPFMTDLARGVEDRANEAGYSVIVCNSDEDADKEDAYLAVLEERRVEGVLLVPVSAASARVERLRARGTAVVRLNHRAAGDDECAAGIDDLRGGELAMAHLLALGHERVAYVTSASHVYPTDERRDGALNALRKAGKSDDVLHEVTVEHLNVSHGRDAGERILGLHPRPTAVFCANDLVALGVLQVMIRHAVRVPDDMAIMGYDDIEFASAAAIPLTSVRQPRQQLGRMAAELLLAEAAGDPEHVHRRVVLQPELVVRASTIGNAG